MWCSFCPSIRTGESEANPLLRSGQVRESTRRKVRHLDDVNGRPTRLTTIAAIRLDRGPMPLTGQLSNPPPELVELYLLLVARTGPASELIRTSDLPVSGQAQLRPRLPWRTRGTRRSSLRLSRRGCRCR